MDKLLAKNTRQKVNSSDRDGRSPLMGPVLLNEDINVLERRKDDY